MQLMLSADTMLCYGAIVNRQMDVPANPRSRRDTVRDTVITLCTKRCTSLKDSSRNRICVNSKDNYFHLQSLTF